VITNAYEFGQVDGAGDVSANSLENIFAMAPLIGVPSFFIRKRASERALFPLSP
jgi:hypothetical protein